MPETNSQIFTDEGGLRTDVYRCTSGKRTWLIGRNLDDRPITPFEWKQLAWFTEHCEVGQEPLKIWGQWLFREELRLCEAELKRLKVDFAPHPEEIKAILLNLAYNMGTTRFNPTKWPKFFRALAQEDYKEMARQLKFSNPDKSLALSPYYIQTKTRAERLYQSLLRIADADQK